LLLVAAGSDPLLGLVLGFGTATAPQGQDDDLYMVSVHHQLRVNNEVRKFELADVITPDALLRAPDAPAALSASIISRTRPQVVDGPALETIGVAWERPLNPVFAQLGDHAAYPVSYVVGRLGPGLDNQILLTPRRDPVGGWFPFVTSKPQAEEARSVIFADHVVRSTVLSGKTAGIPQRLECAYAAAAQDLFGRWGPWSTVAFRGKDEPPQTPSIWAVTVEPSGSVTVDFGWDWSDVVRNSSNWSARTTGLRSKS